jgi:hypothetical protein
MRGREGGALVATLLKHWKKFAFKVDCHRSVTPCRCSMTDMRVKFEHLRIRFTGYACRFDFVEQRRMDFGDTFASVVSAERRSLSQGA